MCVLLLKVGLKPETIYTPRLEPHLLKQRRLRHFEEYYWAVGLQSPIKEYEK